MKALVLKERGVIEYIEKDFPTLQDAHGAILKPILVSPCTSDVHTIWHGSPKKENLTLGHECVAEILCVGEQVKDFKKGDIVAVSAITPDWGHEDVIVNPGHAGGNFSAHMLGKSIDGAFQEAFYLPFADLNLAHVPDGVTASQALMCTDVVSTGFTAVEAAEINEKSTVVVMGIGAIGLAAIMGAKMKGAEAVYAVGSRAENVAIAEKLGAEVINYKTCKCDLPTTMHPASNSTGAGFVNYLLKRTQTKGADAILICGGNDNTFSQAIDICKYGTGIIANVMYYAADDDKRGQIDGIIVPKFSVGRGMAGKTIKFLLSKGGRSWLEYLLSLCQNKAIDPEMFISYYYEGIGSIKNAIYDMKNRKAVKIAVRMG